MRPRLLIINCHSEYFFHIPAGTFGICDYLAKRNIPAKIINLALYRAAETGKVLKDYLDLFQPTHVGIILHWQETSEGFLRAGEQVKSHDRDIRIIGGGFTAGYFGANLLERCGFLDFVIKGDPERPMELLLEGEKPHKIPNLIYRGPSGIRSKAVSWFIDERTLSGLSFSDLSCLHDHHLYIDAINGKLGFPVFIGRGCVHGCRFCGGSAPAFRLHSKRAGPVTRSVGSIISDLKRIRRFTKKIYICYENDPAHIKTLFKSMREEEILTKAFHLNYGIWQLPDKEFLELYKELFVSSGDMRPVFEISPEVYDDEARKKIKPGKVHYSIEELKKSLLLINDHLGELINTSIFFSRYHDTARTYPQMKKEITGIVRLKHELVRGGLLNVRVFYDHLSTDVASRYWEDHIDAPRDFETLLSAIRRVRTRGAFPVDNLCIYVPDTLSEDEVLRCEGIISVLKAFEKDYFEMFHIISGCLDEMLINTIEDIIAMSYTKKKPGDFLAPSDCGTLLNLLKQKIAGDAVLRGRIPFGGDLIDLFIKKDAVTRRSAGPGQDYGGKWGRRVRLNHELLSVHEHDYLDLEGFLKRLDREGVDNLKPERTAYVFLADEILSMPYATYHLTLKEFEDGLSPAGYVDLMKKKGIFRPSYHEELVRKLLKNGVLV